MRLVFWILLCINVLILSWNMLDNRGYPVQKEFDYAIRWIDQQTLFELGRKVEFIKSRYRKYFKTSSGTDANNSDGEMLFMLSEVPMLEAAQRLEQEKRSVQKKKGSVCLWVYPFKSSESAQDVLWDLIDVGVNGSIREELKASDKGYWVYIPPRVSKARAQKIADQLKDEKIDSFPVMSGELANSVSLGILLNKEKAEALKLKVKNKKYPVEIRETSRRKKFYGVEILFEESLLISEDWWEKLSEEYPDLKRAKQTCQA